MVLNTGLDRSETYLRSAKHYSDRMQLRSSPNRQHYGGRARILLLLILGNVCVSLAALSFRSSAIDQPRTLYQLSNLVGPTARSLLDGGGLTACTDGMGTPGNPICFHAGRMPLASLTVAAGMWMVGDRVVWVGLFKTVLFLLPLEFAIYLACRRLPRWKLRRYWMMALLMAPFAMTTFLADVVNLQVEEGYSYSLIALCVALLFFGERGLEAREQTVESVVFGFAAALTYLAKSSMAPAVIVLTVSYLISLRALRLRFLLMMIVVAAPIGWALHQHHSSGRFSFGTSLDGINLHKSNNAYFLARYPPAAGATLDQFDMQLSRDHHFSDEWEFNDFHEHAAFAYLIEHPQATLRGDLRKLYVLFVSPMKIGSGESRGVVLLVETGGLVLFRLVLWTALVWSAYVLWKVPARADCLGLRRVAWTFLALTAAIALPYVAGFAYTRHVSVLIYLASLLCCRFLAEPGPEAGA